MPSLVASAPSNSTLSKKRRFQPPITGYFTTASQPVPSGTPAVSHHHHYSAATFSATPVVPAKVQSSLLSVGMRVRKSVAEGYRTHMAKTEEKVPLHAGVAQTPAAQPCSAELTPFSGSTKRPFDHDEYLVNDDGDAFSIPPSSQQSTSSYTGALGGHKRDLDFDSDMLDDKDYYPQSNTFNDESWQDNSSGVGQSRRILAVRRNMVQQPAMDLDDFEEASFLRRREEVDADYAHMDCA
ncbi:hypothetical protein PENANT_c022G05217 [Penicillium antarcticum]|uniref:Uncharacterized protein n=1 Tax=Penicillium antarcticum TaxID=416450 RepID=A0A1V6PZB9_9EURO|nr:uncharacterized protein N7508_002781 [Penicillium antarcticum]KAJ5311951.1 hypothetical protein N7508_002781 [Penicillium antarcticum]OQD82293.1 hypothetical protein PENANT_c022G05217 [Penicillium antarcticum]